MGPELAHVNRPDGRVLSTIPARGSKAQRGLARVHSICVAGHRSMVKRIKKAPVRRTVQRLFLRALLSSVNGPLRLYIAIHNIVTLRCAAIVLLLFCT